MPREIAQACSSVVAARVPGVATIWPSSKLGRQGMRMVVLGLG
jgi:hypothetical protein